VIGFDLHPPVVKLPDRSHVNISVRAWQSKHIFSIFNEYISPDCFEKSLIHLKVKVASQIAVNSLLLFLCTKAGLSL
jgi:hypothetical protein